MPRTIQPIPFREEFVLRDDVQQFSCGDRPWETEVSDWIKDRNQPAVLNDVKRRHTLVWLYATQDDGLVGFGSLGKTKWELMPGSSRIRLWLIPMLGLDRRFQGQPNDGSEDRFSNQIMDHVISEARNRANTEVGQPEACEPLLGLFVHPQNTKAKHIYMIRFNFAETTVTNHDDETGVDYEGLLLNL